MNLDEANAQLHYSEICHRTEAHRSKILQQGMDSLQEKHICLLRNQRSSRESWNAEKGRLQEIIERQQDMIDMYQSYGAQYHQDTQYHHGLQPAGQLILDRPLPLQYNDSSPYLTNQSRGFIINPGGSPHPTGDINSNIGPSVETACDITSAQLDEIPSNAPSIPVQSLLLPYPTSAERDNPRPNAEEKVRGGKQGKFNKKQRIN